MSTIELTNSYGYTTFTCGNCGTVYGFSDLVPMVDIEQRIAPGEVVPGGQCPDLDCGALCHADATTNGD